MPFADNLAAFYISGDESDVGSALGWGTNIRRLLSSANPASGIAAVSQHGTGGTTTRLINPYTNSATTGANDGDYGWAVDPVDMGSGPESRRYIPAGDHTFNLVFQRTAGSQTGSAVSVKIWRVASAANSYALTEFASGSTSFNSSTSNVTVNFAVACPRIDFGDSETIAYTFQESVSGATFVGNNMRFRGGTVSGEEVKITHPGLRTGRLPGLLRLNADGRIECVNAFPDETPTGAIRLVAVE